MLIRSSWYWSDALFNASQTRPASALLGVLFVSYCFSNVSPALQTGRPVPPGPTSGSVPRHLSPAEPRSRPHAEPGRSCLFSAWQLWEQKIQRVTSWHVYSRSCPCFFQAEPLWCTVKFKIKEFDSTVSTTLSCVFIWILLNVIMTMGASCTVSLEILKHYEMILVVFHCFDCLSESD